MNMKQQTIVLVLTFIVIVVTSIYATNQYWKEKTVLKIFHAGSLTVPFETIEAQFEADQKTFLREVDVQLEPAGSVTCIQKITELGKEADVLASADYRLIPTLMLPNHADWYIIFAKNRMTLAYTENSKYADEVNATNWYEILRRSDVKWGFANPNLDPCGYRTPMVIQLSELEYGDTHIFEDLIEANSHITVSVNEGSYIINSNITDLNPNTARLTIRDKSVELVSLVQAGGLDYAFEYSSVAKQHGLTYLELPASIDLSSVVYADTYSTVTVVKTSGTSTGSPIVYGITIPTNAPNKALAEEWVKYVINEYGQGVWTDNGQPPITPAVTSDLDKTPESLKSYVVDE